MVICSRSRNLLLGCSLFAMGMMGRSPQLFAIEPAELPRPVYQVTVNSSLLDEIAPDAGLNLREAISFLNGDVLLEYPENFAELTPEEQAAIQVLSDAEKTQIVAKSEGDRHTIQFALAPDQTQIQLSRLLPPIRTPHVEINGFSQAIIDETSGAFRQPLISLSPVAEAVVPRGLTITADNVVVQGLSIYGFNPLFPDLVFNTISAGIWVGKAHLLPHEDDLATLPEDFVATTPRDVALSANWLGLTPAGTAPELRSAFGIWLHDADSAFVNNNRILNHDASAIVTGSEATNTTIYFNEIIGNGLAGMPDAIHLGGKIADSIIEENLICRNGGSGIFFYRTDGQTRIANNQILNNGLKKERAAIFVSGSDHVIRNNLVTDQNGSGVAIAAYTDSHRNQILDNQFARLTGLSIDLITRQNVGRQELQVADGKNPPRNSPNRRKDTANGAINSPEFLSDKFYPVNGAVYLDGIADPNAEVTLYQVQEPNSVNGTLNTVLTKTTADVEGRFNFAFTDYQLGTVYSAIAYLPEYGTSEPASNVVIQSLQAPVSPIFKTSELPELPERCRS